MSQIMSVRPKGDGSRLLKVRCPYLHFEAVVAADGTVEIETSEVKTPDEAIADPSHPAMGPGDQLHNLFVEKYNIKPCAKCREVIDEMNALGIAGCIEQRDRIINDIWSRREQLSGWRGLAAKLPLSEFPAKRELGKIYDQVIHLAEGELG